MKFMILLKADKTMEAGALRVSSLEEVVDWVRRCPNPMGDEAEIEIRQIFESADFGEPLTPELRAAEEKMAAQMAENVRA